jgi:hypothetical protein
MGCQRQEFATTGIDESVQLIGGDPFGHIESVGLRIPTIATALAAPGFDKKTGLANALLNRYLFVLAQFSVGAGATAHIRGWRELLTIGVKQGTVDTGFRVAEQEVLWPGWKFQDGNVSFHLTDVGPPDAQGIPRLAQGPNDLDNFSFRWTAGNALLYEVATLPAGDPFYIDLTLYTAPNNGKPWGVPLVPGMSTMYDLRTPWRSGGLPWYSLDIPVQGPRTIALFASVRQTNPLTRLALVPPATFFPEGLSPEEQFLLNFPGAIYWRVGGSLIVDF